MKKKVKRLPLMMFMFMAIMAFSVQPAFASVVGESDSAVVFSLTEGSRQEQTVVMPDGSEAVVGIERVPAITPYAIWSNWKEATNGDWRVYYNFYPFNCEYYIRISNTRITSAWGTYISVLPPFTYSDVSFSWNSTRANLSFMLSSTVGGQGPHYLSAEIIGNQLYTEFG